MVLQLCIMIQKRQRWWTNAPHPPAVLMAMAVHRSNTDGIAQCGMSRATPEATGCRHRATTPSVSPQRPPGQANKQQTTNTPKKLAVLMDMVMRRYVTVHIAQWRRFRALLEATKRRHWASIAANSRNRSRMCRFFTNFPSSTCIKRLPVKSKAPVFNRRITYQTKEKGLTKVRYGAIVRGTKTYIFNPSLTA